jgi:hypothetical protein
MVCTILEIFGRKVVAEGGKSGHVCNVLFDRHNKTRRKRLKQMLGVNVETPKAIEVSEPVLPGLLTSTNDSTMVNTIAHQRAWAYPSA